MDPEAGGVCQAVRTIIVSLDSVGIKNEVVSLDMSDASFLLKEATIIHALGTGKGIWGYTPKLFPWFEGNLFRFDVVIVHGLWQYHSYSLRKAVRFLEKNYQDDRKNPVSKPPKNFIMPHGMLDPYFQRAKGRKLKAIRNWIYWKFIEGFVINEADGVLFTCDEEQRLAMEPFRPYSPKKEIVVGLGVTRPPSYTVKMREAFFEKCPEIKNATYLLFLSRIHKKKGVDILIEAYKKLFATIDVENRLPKLVIAGPGIDTEYGKKLRQLVNETQGLEDFIFFPGMLHGNAKWGAFYGCQTFILPSHQENFGIAVVEALACGKPVLISNQVNIFKEIEDNGAGIVMNDTVEGTTGLLKSWNKLSLERKEIMSTQAKLTYEKKFSLEMLSKKFKEVLTQ
jgi:glycosyltransferase involved in cell wall biosynthesis